MTPNPTTKGMSEAEVLAVLDRAYNAPLIAAESPGDERLRGIGTDIRRARSTIESTFAELAELRNRIDGLHAHFDVAMELCDSIAEDRTALLEVVQRLLPYARDEDARLTALDVDDGKTEDVIRDAEAILSRITAPEASR